MIDIANGTIEFELDNPIAIAKDGEMVKVTNVKFKQPNRKTAAVFENLVSMFNIAAQDIFDVLDKVDPEGAADTKRQAKNKANEQAGKKSVNPENELDKITFESVVAEAQSNCDFVNNLNFDFEKAYKLFEKMLLHGGKFTICWIGGIAFKDAWLDDINYRDRKFMLFLYISFFGKPVKSVTNKGSETQSDSPMEAREV